MDNCCCDISKLRRSGSNHFYQEADPSAICNTELERMAPSVGLVTQCDVVLLVRFYF